MYGLGIPVDTGNNVNTIFQKMVTFRSIVDTEATDNVHVCQNFNLKVAGITSLHGVMTHQLFNDRFSYCDYTRNVYSFLDASSNYTKRPPLLVVRIDCTAGKIKNPHGEIVTVYNAHQWKNFQGTEALKRMTAMAVVSADESNDTYDEIIKYTEHNDDVTGNTMFKLPVNKVAKTYSIRLDETQWLSIGIESDSRANEVAVRTDRQGNVQVMIRHRVDDSKRLSVILTANDDQLGRMIDPLSKVSMTPAAATTLKLNYAMGNYEKSVRKCCDLFKQ